MSKKVLVAGGAIEGIQVALDLADWGTEVTLVEGSPTLHVYSQAESQPSHDAETLRFMPKLLRAASHRNINVITNASVVRVKGEHGDFKAAIVQHPRFVDLDACTSCGRCEQECPVEIKLRYTNTRDGHKAIHLPGLGLKSVPSAYTVDKKGVPPCSAACPAGVNAHGYVALTSKGKFAEALDLITEAVPFPRVLGRICTHPCESKCTRGEIDQPVSICALKRFVADNSCTESSLRRTHAKIKKVRPTGPPQVAIVGSGPAGLTAARDLARLGHRPTVFEALPVAGGMIAVGMPRFRLPREVRQTDINDILNLDIEIRTSTPIGKDLTLQNLQRQGYKAILIATGAHRNQRLNIPGENLSGVIDSIAFLQAFNLKQPVRVGYKVVVIGGGYTAIDSARTAIRLHCEKVHILYRRSLEEMPANPEEVTEAREEGVDIDYLAAPVRIVGQQGKVIGVECIRMRLGEPDKSGRRRPIPIEGSEFFVEADTVIVAVGQRPDLSFLGGDTTLTEGRNQILVEHSTMSTKVPGIFAAGDCADIPRPVINAIATGRRAAISIDRYLRGEELSKNYPWGRVKPVEVDLQDIFLPPIERQKMPLLRYEYRLGNFEEVELGFNANTAVKEAKRCLNCAGCSECLECVQACELDAINHNSATERFELEVDAVIATGNATPKQAAKRHSIYSIAPLSKNGDLSQASAIAAKVMVDLMKYQRASKETQTVASERSQTGISALAGSKQNGQALDKLESRIGIFVCGCGGGISEVVNLPEVVRYCRKLNDVVYSSEIGYACNQEAAEEIKNAARQHNLTHVVLAACSCCNLDQICFSCSDRRICCKSNLLNGNQPDDTHYEFVNIREHCAWVHQTKPKEATAKAKNLIRAGIARVKESQPPASRRLNIERSVLVIGNSLSGMQAAVDLAAQDFQTVLITNDEGSDTTTEQSRPLKQRLQSELVKNGGIMLPGTKLTNVAGTAGRYQATVAHNGEPRTFTVGTIILDLSAGLNGTKNASIESSPLASIDAMEMPPFLLKAFSSDNTQQLVEMPFTEPALSQLPGVFLCGTGPAATKVAEALLQGSAAASKASILLNRGTLDTAQTIAAVDPQRCRGCGTCESICRFEAIMLHEKEPGIFAAQVDEGLCRGCGTCVAHCPSGAITQSGCGDSQITVSLEAILS